MPKLKYAEGGEVEIEIKVGKGRPKGMRPEFEDDDDDDMEEAEGYKAGSWIKGAIKKPGALRSQMGVKAGQKIPAKKLATAAKAPGKLGQRARLAQTLSKMKKK